MTDRIKSVVLWVVLALFIATIGYKGCVQPIQQESTACRDVQAIMRKAGDSLQLTGYVTIWSDSLPIGRQMYERRMFALSRAHTCTVYNDTDMYVEYKFDTIVQAGTEITKTTLRHIDQWTLIGGYWRTSH